MIEILLAVIAGLASLLGFSFWRGSKHKSEAERQARYAEAATEVVARHEAMQENLERVGEENKQHREQVHEEIKQGRRDHFGSQPRGLRDDD